MIYAVFMQVSSNLNSQSVVTLPVTVTCSHPETLMAELATQNANLPSSTNIIMYTHLLPAEFGFRGSLGFSALPIDAWTNCRGKGSDLQPH